MSELFRYRKGHRTRSYGLKRVDDDASELWVVVWERGTPARPRKLATLTDSETEGFLEGVEQELRLGGWSPATG